MGNIDYDRDYYGDLELPSTATVEDVKKQYRKLALQYHPDRNRGKEEDAREKFVIVSAAHEILSNEATKRKYDANRRDRSRSSRGARGNPWANAANETGFPPPPRRGQQPKSPFPERPSMPPRPPTSGAQRYANMASGAQRQSNRHSAEDDFTAWQYMRGGARPSTTTETPSWAEQPTDKKHSTTGSAQRQPSQRQKEASFGTRRAPPPPPRPTTQQPAPAAEGPPLPKRHPTARQPYSSSAETANTRKARQPEPMADPLEQFRDREGPFDLRQPSPYYATTHERTDPFMGAPRHRTGSTSDSAGAQTDTGPNMSCSSSENLTRDGQASARSQSTNRTQRRTSATAPSSADDLPQATAAPVDNSGYAKQRNKENNGPSVYASLYDSDPAPHSSSKYTTPPNVRIQCWSTPYTSIKRGNKEAARPSGTDAQDWDSDLSPFEARQREAIEHILLQRKLKKLHEEGAATDEHVAYNTEQETYIRMNATDTQFDSFSFTVDDVPSSTDHRASQPASRPQMSSSYENINTKFVDDATDNATTWNFTAGPGGNERTANKYARSQSASGIGRVPQQQPGQYQPFVSEDTSADSPSRAFAPESWDQKIEATDFAPQPGIQRVTSSPTRRTGLRKARTIRKTVGTAGLVDDDTSPSSDEPSSWTGSTMKAQQQSHGTGTGNGSPNAMEIDPPLATTATSKGEVDDNPKASVRNIPLEPTRPEWRAGDANAGTQGNGTNTAAQAAAGSMPPPPRPFKAHGSEDSEEFHLNFSDLRNVEPIAPTRATGLDSINDLRSTLPFESRPASTVHIPRQQASPAPTPTPPPAATRTSGPGPVQFPPMPLAPRAPAGGKSLAAWQKYVYDFKRYMAEWDSFNSRITAYWVDRTRASAQLREQTRYAWLDTVDDAALAEYVGWLGADRTVREKWEEACAEHEARVREFMAFKARMKGVATA